MGIKAGYLLGANIQVKIVKQTLLPFPYSTNCFDYSYNQRNNVWPKSQTDCKLEYMRRKELKECKHNYYWIQHLFDNNHQILDFNKTFLNCSVKVDHKFLDTFCQKDCKITDFSVKMSINPTFYYGILVDFYYLKDFYIS